GRRLPRLHPGPGGAPARAGGEGGPGRAVRAGDRGRLAVAPSGRRYSRRHTHHRRAVMKLVPATMVASGAWALAAAVAAQSPAPSPRPAAGPKTLTHAVAVLHPTPGNSVEGTVHFMAASGGVSVKASLKGLAAGSHGFHV